MDKASLALLVIYRHQDFGLVASSEIPELLALCDRIAVMREGRLVGEVPREGATAVEILRRATGAAEARAS